MGLNMHRNKFMTFLKDEKAATAIEYGVIASLISIAIVAGVSGIGTKVLGMFTTLNTSL